MRTFMRGTWIGLMTVEVLLMLLISALEMLRPHTLSVTVNVISIMVLFFLLTLTLKLFVRRNLPGPPDHA